MPAQGMSRGDVMLMGRVVAGMDLLGRSGVRQVELAYNDDGPVYWWCGGNWGGTRMFSEKFPYPAYAVDDLLTRVINGGQCKRCTRTTIVGVEHPDFCCFILQADDLEDTSSYNYVRSCQRGK